MNDKYIIFMQKRLEQLPAGQKKLMFTRFKAEKFK